MSAIATINSQGAANSGAIASRQPAPQLVPAAVHQSDGGSVQDASSKISLTKAANAPSVQQTAQISRESVEAAADKLRSFASSMNRDLNIVVDGGSGKAVIRVVDSASNETVRQIPAEESLRLARTIDYLTNIFADLRA